MVLGEPLCHIGLVYWRQFFMAKSCSAPFVQKKAIHRDLIQTFPKNSNRAGRKRTKSGSTWLMEGAPRPMIWAAHPLAEDLEDLRPWGFPFDPEISTDLHSKCVFFLRLCHQLSWQSSSNKNYMKIPGKSWVSHQNPIFFFSKNRSHRIPEPGTRCLGESGQAHFAVPLEVGAAPGSAEAGLGAGSFVLGDKYPLVI